MSEFSFAMLPGIEGEEMIWLQELTKNYSNENKQRFLAVYQSRRRDPQIILICTLIGLVAVAGIQRFLLNQIVMGILYFVTLGFCFVGTIIDAINYRKLTWEYNKKQAVETAALLGL
ncbi:TM2 domain-containing protein [Chitinophaga silvatica]|uniref:TM2 domain-containing protein n=1 Tax=Chitinophaga silvatica TaxID=2282649 RepID=A0A3E1YBT1_9BACT|nr:TM2 domain-containing protein [Chitinophaga silvatica]RFS23485.1 TM2 domain-containing protein [Chitinophaga silvatica]